MIRRRPIVMLVTCAVLACLVLAVVAWRAWSGGDQPESAPAAGVSAPSGAPGSAPGAAPLALPGLSPSPPPVTTHQRPGPVVLITGFGGNLGVLSSLRRDLQKQGREVVTVPVVGDGMGDITAQAEKAETVIAGLRREGAASIDIVGFSMGGLVARKWYADHHGAGFVRRVVLLGVPNRGTDLAGGLGALLQLQCPVACLQMMPDSTFLQALNVGDPTPEGTAWVSIWTLGDQVVSPAERTSPLEGAVNVELQRICPSITVQHGVLPAAPLVRGLVRQALGPGLSEVPPASQCGELSR